MCFRSFRFAAWLFVLAAPLVGFAQPAPTPSAPADTAAPAAALSPADQAWAEIEALRTRPFVKPGELPAEEMVRRGDALGHEMTAKLEAFYANFPDDPRRWRAVVGMRRYSPLFYVSAGPNPEKPLDGATFDVEARAAHAARLVALETALLAAPDAPAEMKQKVENELTYRRMRALALRGRDGTRAEWDAMVAVVTEFAARQPATPEGLIAGAQLINQTIGAFQNIHGAAEAVGYWARFVDAAEPRLAELARNKVAAQAAFAAPLEINFTAVDGREVSLAKLRGKVVLVDFWATWCGPCIAELPNLKKVYAEYHDKGFEVVGITLENPNARPGDTAEQTAAKLEAAKKKLLNFVAKEQMPWPQYFDGTWWKNDLAARYGVSAIPAMLLLGPDGKVVTTDARGSKLETEVKRLLGL